MTSEDTPGQFLNVDLEVRRAGGLGELLAHLEDALNSLYVSDDFASFELRDVTLAGPESAIAKFASVIDQLSPELRAIWDSCELRRFDLQLRAGRAASFHLALAPATLTTAARVNAEVAVTVYPPIDAKDIAAGND